MTLKSRKARLVRGLVARWGRVARSMTLGVRVAVRDGGGRLLLVRHGYAPGWHLPGGGVDPGETAAEAAVRELREETGVEAPLDAFALHGLFFNPAFGGRDHVAVFRVERFEIGPIPGANREIAEQGWFALDRLPDAVTGATRRRLAEFEGHAAISGRW
jgi:ADP-ribose pyrophosphatase YjhB (NUDIX family)